MKTIEVKGLHFYYYLTWQSHNDTSSLSFIPNEESLQFILDEEVSADKILYDIYSFMDDYFFDLRERFDFIPFFQKNVELFEINIVKKDISTKELSGVIHEYLRAA
ncbi:hypothetical protein WJR50_18225 [Catalinimonas sp. 4WD22]|jgi:hypothetical protein|uniref:hypothetical protein n=1 Tax=Catalinimonas locisalis TaxID=3133978 RepID=UPI003100DE81